MYYDGAKIFLISFVVSIFTSVVVCAAFFFLMPLIKPNVDIVIPDFSGSTTDQARVIAEARGLLLVLGGEEENEIVPGNAVCRQTPLAGSVVKSKSTVMVFISKGSSKIVLPELRGQGLSEATVKLSELGLKVGEVRSEENADIGSDKIISTIPPAGTKVGKGDVVMVILSRGVEVIEVPRLIGKALSTARRMIGDKGLAVGNVSYEVSTEINVGIIMRQQPVPGAKVKRGYAINLVVATVLE